MSDDSNVSLDMIVFDFDGTICDSARIKDEAFRLLYLDEMGDAFADEVKSYHMANAGVSRFDKIAHIEQQMLGHTLSAERLNEVAARFGEIVEDQVVAAPLINGVAEFLSSHDDDRILTIASATPTDELRRIVHRRRMTEHFSAVEGSPDTKGEIILRYLDRYDILAERAVMVGDQMSDHVAASHAGVAFIGVGNQAPDLEPTVAVIGDLTGLSGAIREAFTGSSRR